MDIPWYEYYEAMRNAEECSRGSEGINLTDVRLGEYALMQKDQGKILMLKEGIIYGLGSCYVDFDKGHSEMKGPYQKVNGMVYWMNNISALGVMPGNTEKYMRLIKELEGLNINDDSKYNDVEQEENEETEET